MIYALIALITAGVVIAALAIIATIALRRNSLLERYHELAKRALEEANAGKEALKAENGKLQQELHYAVKERDTNKLQSETSLAQLSDISATMRKVLVRNAVLEEELAAKPTMPAKRVVRKNTSTPQTTEEARQAEQAARYNAEMDERNRISAENRDKPWLPLHDGE